MHVPESDAATVLVVEDEPVTRTLFASLLASAGFIVRSCATAAELRGSALTGVGLVLLDIELPDGDGFALAEWLRRESDVGIIFVSRRGEARDRVRGLELGGDDFVVKPPDVDELLARVRAVLRRRRGLASAPSAATFGGWTFDTRRFLLAGDDGVPIPVTPGEANVLARLVEARGAVVPRQTLIDALAGEGSPRARSVDVIVHRLRRKLGEGGNIAPRLLLTVHGVGYRIGVEVVT